MSRGELLPMSLDVAGFVSYVIAQLEGLGYEAQDDPLGEGLLEIFCGGRTVASFVGSNRGDGLMGFWLGVTAERRRQQA